LSRALRRQSSPWEAHIAGVIIGALTCVVEWRYFNLDFASAIPGLVAGGAAGASGSSSSSASSSSSSGGINERTKLMEHDEDENDRIDAHGVA
jgi:hypothetical protein